MTGHERHIPSSDPAHDKASRMLSLRVIIEGLAVAGIGSAQSWNLGCSSVNSQMGDSSSQDTCWQSGDVTTDTSTLWLDACTGSGSHFATYTYPSAYIKTKNCTLTGASNGNVIAY